MIDPEPVYHSTSKNHHHRQPKDRVSHKQKSLPPRHRDGPPIDTQLKDAFPFEKNASLLRHGYGRGGAPVDFELQNGGAKKVMNPASPSQALSSSEESDSFPDCLQEDILKTKVIVRCLPPSLSEESFTECIHPRFDGCFNWISFCPGKTSIKNSSNSRVYIDFKSPEDVFKFHEEFNGHVFVNEKGTRHKALVEYAPNQKVPKRSPKDIQEGSISEDPKYLEFQNFSSLPIPLLPSAEVQLERKEAERRISLAGSKKTVVVTPLMEFVREKRAMRAQSAVLATGKKSPCRGSFSLAKSAASLRRVPDMLKPSLKYTSTAAKPTEKSIYVPCPRHAANQCREVSLDTKKKAVFEAVGKVVMKEKGLDKTIQNDQKFGASTHSVNQRQMRKEVKKSKQMGGFQSHEKQVWVAKSASGS
eukprot:c9992_g1_i1 orf=691-1941(-)